CTPDAYEASSAKRAGAPDVKPDQFHRFRRGQTNTRIPSNRVGIQTTRGTRLSLRIFAVLAIATGTTGFSTNCFRRSLASGGIGSRSAAPGRRAFIATVLPLG